MSGQERPDWKLGQFRAGKRHEGRGPINNVLRDFKTILRRAGVGPCTVPDLCRSCLTNWARQVPAHVLQKLAGHSSMETTLKYRLSVDRSDLGPARQVGDPATLSGIPPAPRLTQSGTSRQDGEVPASSGETADWRRSPLANGL